MITVHHSGDGTTVEGTTRDDAPTIKRVGGFKWSSNLGVWYLPRAWREPTRLQRARQLMAAFGPDRAVLEIGDLAKSLSAEEQAQTHVSRSEELANRHAVKAARLGSAADQFSERSRQAVEGIPFGQPVLVGHHSERRHRRALDDSWNLLGKSVEASKAADLEEQRARSSAAEVAGYDQPARVGRRIEKNRAELRTWERNRARYDALPTGTVQSERDRWWLERADVAIAELRDKIARDERVLEESGVTDYSKETVHAGDLVRIRGKWLFVDKANPKTVAVTSFGLALKYPYTEIQGHRRVTEEEMRVALRQRHVNDLKATLRSRFLNPTTRRLTEEVVREMEEN